MEGFTWSLTLFVLQPRLKQKSCIVLLCTEAEGMSQSTSNWNYINLCVFSSGFGADVMLLSLLVHLETSATALFSSPSCSQLLGLAVTPLSACLLVLEVCGALLRAMHSPCPHWAPTRSFVVESCLRVPCTSSLAELRIPCPCTH